MLIVLPPSETKTRGGELPAWDVDALTRPSLNPVRRRLVRTVRALARDVDASRHALRLTSRQDAEIVRNREITRSPTTPALRRYTGVLFEPIDADRLSQPEWDFAATHVVIHSALFGIISATDPIPAYRLSHDSRVPETGLKAQWSDLISRSLAEETGLVIDLRSAGYTGLGRRPVRRDSVYVRVLAHDADGRRRAVNHFNKRAKGELTAALIRARERLDTVEDLVDWADTHGFALEVVDRGDTNRGAEVALIT